MEAFITSNNFDLVCLSETFLDPTIPNDEVNIPPGQKLGNRGNHGNHGNSSWTSELQILEIKIKKEKCKSKFDKVWEWKL